MNYMNIGDTISYDNYNAIVYLLRKFKRLTSKLQLGKSQINSDYGTYNILGLTSIDGNWILENDANIISNNCLLNCYYTFNFTVINVDTSGEVNKRVIHFTGGTGETGELNITIPQDSISSDEQILSDFTVYIIFDEHEYYTPSTLFNIDLTSNKEYITNEETAVVTATITDENGDPIGDFPVNFNVNGTITSESTDATGKATLNINGTGETGLIKIRVYNKEIQIIDYYFYDHAILTDHNLNYWFGLWEAYYQQESTIIRLCDDGAYNFCPSSSTTQTDITKRLEFDTPYSMEFDIYGTSENVHLRVWDGNASPWTVYFDYTITKKGHYNLIVKEDVIQLWVDNTLIEESVNVIDDTSVSFVTMKTINSDCKYLDYANLVIYNMHSYALSVTGDSIIQRGDTASVVATLTDNGVAVSGESLSYQVKHGSTVIDSGSSTTDSNGQATINYTGTGAGDVDVIVSFGMSLQKTFVIEDCLFGDDMTVANSKYTITGSMSTNEHNSNGWKYGNGSGLVWIDLNNYICNEAISIEYTPTEINDRSASLTPIMIYFENSSQTRIYFTQATTFVQLNSSTKTNHNASLGSEYRVEYTANTLKLYLGDTLISSVNHSLGTSNIKVRLHTGRERYCRLKNFKIKAL